MITDKRGKPISSLKSKPISDTKKIKKPTLRFNSKKILLFVGIPLIILITVLILFIFGVFGKSQVTLSSCGDGTFYETCSLNKPYYCSEGVLVEKASICGCPEEFSKSGETCLSKYQSGAKDITLNYIVDSVESEIPFTVYKGVADYLAGIPPSINYANGEKSFRVDFKLKKIDNEIQRQMLLPLIVKIQNLAHDEDEQARIAISLVQNINWAPSTRKSSFVGQLIDYSRYPYEVLYEEQGICGEKSELLAFLLKELGYGTSLFYFEEENHESVGIECPVKYSLDGTGYCFVETSGPAIISDSSMSYEGGLVLTSKPEVLLISQGISLGDNLREYKDAKKITMINTVTRRRGWIGPFWKRTLAKFKERYGLIDMYNFS
jgi:hypothetical protein